MWGHPGSCVRAVSSSSSYCHPTPIVVSEPTLPSPVQSPVPSSPPIYSINKPQAGPRQRIMVHLEVTGKENRSLCITNGDRDKHCEALRNLDKGLSKHVWNWNIPFRHTEVQCFNKSQSYNRSAEHALLIFFSFVDKYTMFSLCTQHSDIGFYNWIEP